MNTAYLYAGSLWLLALVNLVIQYSESCIKNHWTKIVSLSPITALER